MCANRLQKLHAAVAQQRWRLLKPRSPLQPLAALGSASNEAAVLVEMLVKIDAAGHARPKLDVAWSV